MHTYPFSIHAKRSLTSPIAAANSSLTSKYKWGQQEDKLTNISPLVHEVIDRPGQALDHPVRSLMESRFGHNFNKVRVYTNSEAAASAQALQANAYSIGHSIVFNQNRYKPTSMSGQRLIAHELAHLIQQNRGDIDQAYTDPLSVNRPNDIHEQEAEKASQQVLNGSRATVHQSLMHPVLQCDRATKEEEKKDTGEILAEGLKKVAEEAMDNNEKVKKQFINPLEDKLKGKWESLPTGEKVALGTFGTGMVSLIYGGLLSDANGRKALEDINLATPLKLVPKMPLDSFKYTLPSGDAPTERLFQFETNFDASDLVNMHTEARNLPEMSLKVNMRWAYDPLDKQLRIIGGNASIGLVPGLTLSGRAVKF